MSVRTERRAASPGALTNCAMTPGWWQRPSATMAEERALTVPSSSTPDLVHAAYGLTGDEVALMCALRRRGCPARHQGDDGPGPIGRRRVVAHGPLSAGEV